MDNTTEPMFMNLTDACKATGCSVYNLRRRCINKKAPFIKVGKKYLINVPALREQLDAESRSNGNGGS